MIAIPGSVQRAQLIYSRTDGSRTGYSGHVAFSPRTCLVAAKIADCQNAVILNEVKDPLYFFAVWRPNIPVTQ